MMKRLDAVERDLDRAGHHVDELTSAAKQLEARIYSGKVKNLKELDKLQEKRENHKAKIVEIEEKALTLLEEQENLAEGISREKHEISKMKSRFNQERLKIKEEIDKITKELEDAAKEKHQVLVNLPLEILDKYNRVKIKRAEPVAIVENGQCTGCRMGVSIMLAQEVQITQKVIYCENCGRILVPNEEEI